MTGARAAAEHDGLLEYSPAALLAVDTNGEIQAHSRALSAWLGVPEAGADLRGRNIVEWLTPSSRLLYETRILPQLFETGHAREVVLELRTAEGATRAVLCNAEVRVSELGTRTIYIAAFDAGGRISFERELVEARLAADEAHERLALLQETTSALAVARGVGDLAEALVHGAGRATHAAWTAVRVAAQSSADPGAGGVSGGAAGPRGSRGPGGAAGVADAGVVGVAGAGEPRVQTWGELPPGLKRTGALTPRAERLVCRTPAEIAESFPDTAHELHAGGVEALIIAPITRGTGDDARVLGEIVCGFRRPRALEPDELETLHALGVQAERVIEHLHLQEQLRHRALHDGLTGLPNRVLFAERLGQLLAVSARTGEACAVLFIDLDGFKAINDGAGHAAGDEVLRAVAARVRASCRAGDTVSRLGGDEFVVAVSGATREAVTALAERIRAAVREPLDAIVRGARLSTSVGVARWDPTPGGRAPTVDGLMNAADAAMYTAKYGGKDAVVVREWAGEPGA
ncbi:GGDEF domain-containing protein [Leucobacter luti]|uniref:PAS domain S-box-containing protein/diguanylate cyclase (GGDEF)-like protein n=1 Tax=Leucobacter luti TaxID=340320 RepID=A0A4Q7TT08_9MICO|nr:GGDEF domain-containing protein [Leucobacter luti]RZT62692.1 PAS domain S-box-containing protein/diguanylate cyclase (GGDEF)-like protein [Leucobacter luti]